MTNSEIKVGQRVIIVNGRRHQGLTGVVTMLRNGRVGVELGRFRLWFAASDLGRVA